MESLYGLPFKILEVPNLRLKRPSWLKKPSAMFMYVIVMISYFLVTGGKYLKLFNKIIIFVCINVIIYFVGIIYDVIIEPPSVGSTTDEKGHSRPVK